MLAKLLQEQSSASLGPPHWEGNYAQTLSQPGPCFTSRSSIAALGCCLWVGSSGSSQIQMGLQVSPMSTTQVGRLASSSHTGISPREPVKPSQGGWTWDSSACAGAHFVAVGQTLCCLSWDILLVGRVRSPWTYGRGGFAPPPKLQPSACVDVMRWANSHPRLNFAKVPLTGHAPDFVQAVDCDFRRWR